MRDFAHSFRNRITVLKAIFIVCLFLAQIPVVKAETPFHEPPSWASEAIWYQIFVERFRNGDTANDPSEKFMKNEVMNIVPPEGWKITPWTQSWYRPDDWMKDGLSKFNNQVHYRRYGGDLQGVMDQLDYLQKLGVNAIYFNPLNDAPSMHKYDARNYHHIDVNFGPDPDGDMALIAQEDLNDPSTWHWTSADKLFLALVDSLHERGIRVIMDYSWNHVGTQFSAWLNILKNQSESPYKDWFNINSFDNPKTAENEFSYDGWMGNAYMPEVKKVDVTTPRKNGHPYEGNIAESPKNYIYAVTERWLKPNGELKHGIDGYRLDVADQIGLGFWRDWRKCVRNIQPDAYLVGEIWWAQWPDELMDPKPYVQGDIFDAVMFYQAYMPARYYFARTHYPLNASQFKDSLEKLWNRLPSKNVYAMMNTSSTHDSPRLLTSFYNPNKYKYHANTHEDPAYKTGRPDKETFLRLRMYLVHLFTTIGAPQIWNGEEMGMWGADDPHCRKPLMWPEMQFEPEIRQANQTGDVPVDPIVFDQEQFDFYQQLIRIRKDHPALNHGTLEFIVHNGASAIAATNSKDNCEEAGNAAESNNKLVYVRKYQQEEILVVFNVSDKPSTQKLQGKYVELLSGDLYEDKIDLPSYTAVILLKN